MKGKQLSFVWYLIHVDEQMDLLTYSCGIGILLFILGFLQQFQHCKVLVKALVVL